MANKTWIAVALSCLIWFAYLKWLAPPLVAPQDTEVSTPAGGTASAPVATTTTPGVETTKSTEVNAWEYTFSANAERQFQTSKNKGLFSDQGGKLATNTLLAYHTSIKKDASQIELIEPTHFPLAFASVFTEPSYRGLTENKYNAASQQNGILYSRKENGVEIEKAFSWSDSGYRLQQRIQIRFTDGDKRRDRGFLYLPVGGKDLTYHEENPLLSWEVASYQNDSIKREKLEKFEGEKVFQGSTQWVAFGNRYFSSAVIHKSGINPDVVFLKNTHFAGGYLRYPLVMKDGEKEIVIETELYSGAKEYLELSKSAGMKRLIDYGTFSFFAFPMLEILRFFYKWVHNYGLAIILLTLLVRILFFPLQMKSFASMKAMQKLQPQIAALKEKYKEEPQRFNQEQMALFKTNKVNPMGGCLPMLVQLPVFIALYAVLGNSIELFHAPFFGWIQDLSAKDPYFVFPVLMGISMLFQQRLTPTPGMDPMQAKMMYLMPVVFTFIMLNLPSGLTIYIFLSTVMGIAQQLWMNKDKKGTTPQLSRATTPSS